MEPREDALLLLLIHEHLRLHGHERAAQVLEGDVGQVSSVFRSARKVASDAGLSDGSEFFGSDGAHVITWLRKKMNSVCAWTTWTTFRPL